MGVDIDTKFLISTCLKLEVDRVLELGVWRGYSTRAFLEALRVIGGKLISVDIEDCSRVVDNPNWEFHRMNDLDFELDEDVDILFIDTSHTYKQTLAELTRFVPHAKKAVILHDTESCPEVKEAILDYIKDKPIRFENRLENNGLGVLWLV